MTVGSGTAGVRTALAMFTVLPVPSAWHAADGARRCIVWLPLAGAGLGAAAGLPAAAVLAGKAGATSVAALLAVASLAVLTRGLHLDGLADTADGLGSRAAAQRALEIMRRSDIGPFGVVTLVLVLLADVMALSMLGVGHMWLLLTALTLAAATGRVAVVHACLRAVPAARAGGFGALVTGTTSPVQAVAWTLAVLGGGAGLALACGESPVGWPVAQAAGLLAAALLRLHTTRRFGGITGDVFGALVEAGTAVTLVGMALS